MAKATEYSKDKRMLYNILLGHWDPHFELVDTGNKDMPKRIIFSPSRKIPDSLLIRYNSPYLTSACQVFLQEVGFYFEKYFHYPLDANTKAAMDADLATLITHFEAKNQIKAEYYFVNYLLEAFWGEVIPEEGLSVEVEVPQVEQLGINIPNRRF